MSNRKLYILLVVQRRYYVINYRKLYILIVFIVLSKEDIMFYRKVYILIVFIVLSQEDIMSYRKVYILLVVPRRLRARKRRYYVIQKIINSNSFYSLVPRRYYVGSTKSVTFS